jgi:hypothetical protein
LEKSCPDLGILMTKKPSYLGIEILEKSCPDLGILMSKKLHI